MEQVRTLKIEIPERQAGTFDILGEAVHMTAGEIASGVFITLLRKISQAQPTLRDAAPPPQPKKPAV